MTPKEWKDLRDGFYRDIRASALIWKAFTSRLELDVDINFDPYTKKMSVVDINTDDIYLKTDKLADVEKWLKKKIKANPDLELAMHAAGYEGDL